MQSMIHPIHAAESQHVECNGVPSFLLTWGVTLGKLYYLFEPQFLLYSSASWEWEQLSNRLLLRFNKIMSVVSNAVLCLLAQLCLTLCYPMDCSPPGSSVHWDFPVKNTAVGCHSLLQGIFPNQGSNPGLPHCRWILYHSAIRESLVSNTVA